MALPPFSHPFVDSLPGDPSRENTPRQVRGAAYSLVDPTPVRSPLLAGWSQDLADLFGIPRPPSRGEEVDVLAGNKVLPGMKPFAACYGGHQFGHWAGQLGDGRAITLGEALDRNGQSWEFQLKGAGLTPYSRTADGRAVMRSSIREFICSEAMHFLGVPTTRALSVVATGEGVLRDMFYDGNPAEEPGAVVCRVSPSFLRFGNFEIFASRGETELLRQLTDYTIQRYFPKLGSPSEETYLAFFQEVVSRTALLMAHWMRVGFVHGVMNTDNMSILGLTIDYGPYGWLEDFNPLWTPNTTDLPGRRYCYGRQPAIGLWNLAQLGRALSPLLPDSIEELERILNQYQSEYEKHFLGMYADKLGLISLAEEAERALLAEMHELLQAEETDMTIFFRGLMEFRAPSESLPEVMLSAFYQPPSADLIERWKGWFKKYHAFLSAHHEDPSSRLSRMERANPIYVPRNYLLQKAIERAEQGEFTAVGDLLEVFRQPYTAQPGREAFAAKRPEWARNKAGCSTLSCSS